MGEDLAVCCEDLDQMQMEAALVLGAGVQKLWEGLSTEPSEERGRHVAIMPCAGWEGGGRHCTGQVCSEYERGLRPQEQAGPMGSEAAPGSRACYDVHEKVARIRKYYSQKEGTLQQQRDTKRALGFMQKAHDSAVNAMKAQESKGGRLNLQSRDTGSTAGGTFGSTSSATSSCGV